MSDAVPTTPAGAPAPRSWQLPRITELPKLTKLTLASAIGGGGGTGGGGSTVFGILLALLALTGCSAARDLAAPTESRRPTVSARITCRADRESATLDCSGPARTPGTNNLGGQGVTVALRSSNVSYDGGTGILSADVTLQNLSPAPLGSFDGATHTSAIDIFLEADPIADPTGTVTVSNADGTSTFTAANQVYFEYDTMLTTGQTSLSKPWEFQFAGGATSFTFTVLVAAEMPVQGGILRWRSLPGVTPAFFSGITGWGTNGLAVSGTKGEVFVREGSGWVSRADPVGYGPRTPYFYGLPSVGATGGSDLWSYTYDNNNSNFPIRRFDGKGWRNMESLPDGPGLFSAATQIGNDSRGIFAIGQGFWHWTDAGWVTDTIPTAGGIYFVAATVVDSQVLAVTYDGQVFLNDGPDWIRVGGAGSGQSGQISLIVASDTNHIMVIQTGGSPEARYWDGATWSTKAPPQSVGAGFLPIGGVAPAANAFYVIANDVNNNIGYVWKWDGASWTVDRDAGWRRFGAIWARSASEVYVAGEYGGVERRNGSGSWSYTLRPTNRSVAVATLPDSSAIVGMETGAVYRYAGGTWVVQDSVDGPIGSVWASGANDIWVSHPWGDHRHFDGSSWSSTNPGASIEAFGGSGPTDVWGVGAGEEIVHWNGSTWDPSSGYGAIGFEQLEAVWAPSASFAVAVGGNGTILTYDGFSWSPVTPVTSEYLQGVGGTSESDVWVVGTNGTIIHYDGSTWSIVPSGTSRDLRGVWARSTDEVYAVGSNAALQVYNGIAWRSWEIQTHSGFDYTGIAGVPGGIAYIAGTGLMIGSVP